MKTVKSVSDLKQMALRSGAAVAMGQTRFNTSNEKVAALHRPVAKPEPVEEPAPVAEETKAEPVEVNVDLAPVAQAMDRMQQMHAALVQSLTQQLTQQMAQLKPEQAITEWEFKINRNPDGTLASIRAKAIR